MTPNDLYAMEPTETTKELWVLVGCRYNHVPEALTLGADVDWSRNVRLEMRTYKYVNHDGRRFWLLAGVYLDGKPVMIIQNAGREGDDHSARFVTDGALYFEMVRYLGSLVMGDQKDIGKELVLPDQDVEGLTEFYGDQL